MNLIRVQAMDRGALPVRMVFADARDDMSAFILEDFLKAGFREVEWRYGFETWQNTDLWREMGSVCPVCFALDGQRFKIEWLLSNMTHSAPKYTMAHVNCQCQLFRITRTDEMLDFGEKVDVAPSQIDESLKMSPIEIGDVPQGDRDHMGLPPEANEWTDIKWMWDQTRGEFVPLQTMVEGGDMPSWLWDDETQEFIAHEEWVRRYGF